MHVVIDRTKLLKSLRRVYRIVERRNTMPILSNVLIVAENGKMHLKATDLDLEVMETTDVNVKRSGGTTVPAYLLHDIVRKLSDRGEVILQDEEDKRNILSIVSGHSNFQLQCLPKEDFPQMEAGNFICSFKLKTQDLKRLIDRTQFAISTEETRYYLNGIYFHILEKNNTLKLRAVATDGHRLARMEIEAPSGSEKMIGIIIPRKTVSELKNILCDEIDTQVFLEISERKVRFTVGSVILTSKLIDGSFPDYQRVIPVRNDKKLVMNRLAFSTAVNRVSTISNERGRAVKLYVSKDLLRLTVTNPVLGTAKDQLFVDYKDEEIEIGFNYRYLLDIAAQMSSEEIVFLLSGKGSPVLIQENISDQALYVLMPMRI